MRHWCDENDQDLIDRGLEKLSLGRHNPAANNKPDHTEEVSAGELMWRELYFCDSN